MTLTFPKSATVRSRASAPGRTLKWRDLALLTLVALTGASLFSGIETRVAGKLFRPFDALVALSAVWMMIGHLGLMLKALERLQGIVLAWISLMGIRALSAYFNGMTAEAIVAVIQAGEFAMLVLAIAVATRRPELRDAFIRVFFFLVSLIAVYAFFSHFGGGALSSLKRLDEPKYSYGFVCLFLAASWVSGRPRMASWLRISLFVPAAVLLLVSGERSAWVGMIGVAIALGRLGIFSLGTRGMRRRLTLTIAVLCVVSVGVVVVLAQTNEFVSRQFQRFVEPVNLVDWRTGEIHYQYAESPSNRARLFQISNLIHIGKTMPLTGTGTELYRYYAYPMAMGSGLQVISGMHGQYTLFLAENGIFAFGLYCLIWILFFRKWKKAWRWKEAEIRESLLFVYAVGVYAALITWFIAGGSAGLFVTFLPVGMLGGILLQRSTMSPMRKDSTRSLAPRKPSMVTPTA